MSIARKIACEYTPECMAMGGEHARYCDDLTAAIEAVLTAANLRIAELEAKADELTVSDRMWLDQIDDIKAERDTLARQLGEAQGQRDTALMNLARVEAERDEARRLLGEAADLVQALVRVLCDTPRAVLSEHDVEVTLPAACSWLSRLAASPVPSPGGLPAPVVALAVTVGEEGEKLLHSLGEYVRQSMTFNPEWRGGVRGLEAAVSEFRRVWPRPIRTIDDEPLPTPPAPPATPPAVGTFTFTEPCHRCGASKLTNADCPKCAPATPGDAPLAVPVEFAKAMAATRAATPGEAPEKAACSECDHPGSAQCWGGRAHRRAAPVKPDGGATMTTGTRLVEELERAIDAHLDTATARDRVGRTTDGDVHRALAARLRARAARVREEGIRLGEEVADSNGAREWSNAAASWARLTGPDLGEARGTEPIHAEVRRHYGEAPAAPKRVEWHHGRCDAAECREAPPLAVEPRESAKRAIPDREHCPACAKVRRHPGEGYACGWHDKFVPVPAPPLVVEPREAPTRRLRDNKKVASVIWQLLGTAAGQPVATRARLATAAIDDIEALMSTVVPAPPLSTVREAEPSRIEAHEQGRRCDFTACYCHTAGQAVREAERDLEALLLADLQEATRFLAAALYGQFDGPRREEAKAFLLTAHDSDESVATWRATHPREKPPDATPTDKKEPREAKWPAADGLPCSMCGAGAEEPCDPAKHFDVVPLSQPPGGRGEGT